MTTQKPDLAKIDAMLEEIIGKLTKIREYQKKDENGYLKRKYDLNFFHIIDMSDTLAIIYNKLGLNEDLLQKEIFDKEGQPKRDEHLLELIKSYVIPLLNRRQRIRQLTKIYARTGINYWGYDY